MPALTELNVVLLVFNRPELTERVLERVRDARPTTLLVVADGPRPDHPDDIQKCAKVRQLISSRLDWDVRLLTNYAEANMGLRQRVSSGLTWVFENVERAIILEDDCVPEPSFFPFCAELLERYADDTRIGAVTGDNYQLPSFTCEESYYFSKYPHCWGWATWRRAWKHFDRDMERWPALKESGFLRNLFDEHHALFWETKLDRVYRREINSWAFPWTFSFWSQNMLSIIPKANLVTNVGFGEAGTNTKRVGSLMSELPTYPMEFPLRHPQNVVINYPADSFTQGHIYNRKPPTPPAPVPVAPSAPTVPVPPAASENESWLKQLFGKTSPK